MNFLKTSFLIIIFFINLVDLNATLIPISLTATCKQSSCNNLMVTIKSSSTQFQLNLFKNKLLFGPKVKVEKADVNCYYLSNQLNITASISFCNNLIEGIATRYTSYEVKHSKSPHLTYYLEEFSSNSFLKLGDQPQESCDVLNGPNQSIKSRTELRSSSRLNQQPNLDQFPPRFIEIYLVCDHELYLKKNSDPKEVLKFQMDIVEGANSILLQLNVRLVVIGMEIWHEGDKIPAEEHGHNFLQSLLDYANGTNAFGHDYDAIIFFRKKQFKLNPGVGGTASGHSLCHDFPNIAMIITDLFLDKNMECRVIWLQVKLAHELGHLLGFNHVQDNPGCRCAKTTCVISRMTSSGYTDWSDCSRRTLQANDYDKICLTAPSFISDSTKIEPICGNGLKEPGEECDCLASDPECILCCDSLTCKLRVGSECSSGDCCKKCHLVSASENKQCGEAGNEHCETPPKCDGKQESCPLKGNSINPGTQCTQNGIDGHCFEGQCQTREAQCKHLFGSNSYDCPEKYQENSKGFHGGHCHYDWSSGKSKGCDLKDVDCGALKCFFSQAGNISELLVNRKPGPYPGPFKVFQFDQCVSVTYKATTPSGGRDYGLVADGTKCPEDDHYCIDQKCVPINSTSCPGDCHGNGRCDLMSHSCLCNQGFSGPNCSPIISSTTPSGGCKLNCGIHGKCDSGTGHCICDPGFDGNPDCQSQATTPHSDVIEPVKTNNSQNGWIIFMIVFGVILFIAVLSFGIYYFSK